MRRRLYHSHKIPAGLRKADLQIASAQVRDFIRDTGYPPEGEIHGGVRSGIFEKTGIPVSYHVEYICTVENSAQ